MTSFKILGYDDSVNECDCCGKSNLKMTVVVEVNGEVMHYGCVCATRHTGLKSGEIKNAIASEKERKVKLACEAFKTNGIAKEYHLESEKHQKNGLIGRAFHDVMTDVRTKRDNIIKDIAKQFGVEVHEIFYELCV